MRTKILILLLFPVFLTNFACDKKKAVEPVIDKEERGKGLIINQSELRLAGIDTLFINEEDTVKLVASTILPEKHNYSWISGDENVLKIIADAEVDSIAFAVATGTNGSLSTLILDDSGNDALKTIPVKIVKYRADPLVFSYMGSLNEHHYYMSKSIMVWTKSKIVCEEAGGHLVTITSSEESQFLNNKRNPAIENNWIGLTFLFGNDNLTHWITGEVVVFLNFSGSKPIDPGIFAEYYFYMQKDGKWKNWHEISYNCILEME